MTISLKDLSELNVKVAEYEAAALALEKLVNMTNVVVFYNGHDCDRHMDAETLDAVRALLVERQHHRVLQRLSALAKEGVDVAGEVERFSEIVRGYRT